MKNKEEKMPYVYTEIDPSGRATCSNIGCGKIPKGEKRLVIEFKGFSITRIDRYCKKCGKIFLESLLKELDEK